jgi:hypothetical protein
MAAYTAASAGERHSQTTTPSRAAEINACNRAGISARSKPIDRKRLAKQRQRRNQQHRPRGRIAEEALPEGSDRNKGHASQNRLREVDDDQRRRRALPFARDLARAPTHQPRRKQHARIGHYGQRRADQTPALRP